MVQAEWRIGLVSADNQDIFLIPFFYFIGLLKDIATIALIALQYLTRNTILNGFHNSSKNLNSKPEIADR